MKQSSQNAAWYTKVLKNNIKNCWLLPRFSQNPWYTLYQQWSDEKAHKSFENIFLSRKNEIYLNKKIKWVVPVAVTEIRSQSYKIDEKDKICFKLQLNQLFKIIFRMVKILKERNTNIKFGHN